MIFQEPLTVLFPAVEEAGGKLFPGNCGQKKIGQPGSVRSSAFGPSKSFIFIAFSLGARGDETSRIASRHRFLEGDEVQSITYRASRSDPPLRI